MISKIRIAMNFYIYLDLTDGIVKCCILLKEFTLIL